jgi:thiol-disulfide isomerase/thioredoxin
VRFVGSTAILFAALSAGAENPASALWNDLKAKREKLASLHQEFDVSETSKTSRSSRTAGRQVVVDMSQGRWRETSVSGPSALIRIFDGKNIFLIAEQADEYMRTNPQFKDEDPAPFPYGLGDPDWSKAIEVRRQPCGLAVPDHVCVVLDAPLRPSTRTLTGTRSSSLKLMQGSAHVMLDTETGLLISSRTVQLINVGTRFYQSDTVANVKRMSYGGPADAGLFERPLGVREAKEFSTWSATKIRKQLAGKPAVELTLTDLKENPLALADFKGKTVLLDFWATWCRPCRADGPALEKLYRKYGDKDLMIVAVSVGEKRGAVEQFLRQNPRSYLIVLSTENEMPMPYHVSALPTYIVINRDGAVATAAQGDQGYEDLLKLLKKAGLESE